MKLVNKTGYLKGAKTAKNPVNIIPSSLITTQGMAFPIKANGKTLYPNTGQYKFPTPNVVETPLKQKGALSVSANNKKQFADVANMKPKAPEKEGTLRQEMKKSFSTLNKPITFGQKPGSIGDKVGSVLNLGSSRPGQGYSITPTTTAKETALNYATGEAFGLAVKPAVKYVTPYLKQAGKYLKDKIIPKKVIPKTNKQVYDLNSEDDYGRFLENNQLPPPPSEIQFLPNGTTRTIYNQQPITNSINLRRDWGFADMTNKNKKLSLFESLKGTLKEADLKLGEKISKTFNKNASLDKIAVEANKQLKTGVGVKKVPHSIELKPASNSRLDVFINNKRTGGIVLNPIKTQRSFTDMLLNKNTNYFDFQNAKYKGLKKSTDMPFNELGLLEQEKLKGTGISGEINKALSESLKSKGKRLYSGGTGHTDDGWNRYNNLKNKNIVEDITPKEYPKDKHNSIFMYKKKGVEKIKTYKKGSKGVSLAFSRGEKDPKGGLTQKGVDKYNRATGGNLKMAVTTPPSKLKAGSKAANRRKSFCARMSGVKGPMTKPNGKPSRKALALRKWNC